MRQPTHTADAIAQISLDNLEFAVRVDSQSDERSASIPSTIGQRELAAAVADRFSALGAAVETDANANVIARLPGRGTGAGKAPVAFMVHLDTSRGTQAVDRLSVVAGWDGSAIPYPANSGLWVDVGTYPEVAGYVGQDLVFGPGQAPFGLDNKLGLAHMLTLARLLAENPSIPHPPLLLVSRPDEEIGRMAAVEGLADLFADEGVPLGYTLDGLLPYEVNVENFNAARVGLVFEDKSLEVPGPLRSLVRVSIGGVNTHGATAKAEGYRAATRLAAELLLWLEERHIAPTRAVPAAFASDPLRDCDAVVDFVVGGADAHAMAEATAILARGVEEVVEPHTRRGASWKVEPPVAASDATGPYSRATWDMLAFVQRFMVSAPGFALLAEDSDGHDGYSNPYRALPVAGGIQLDVRLRDFQPDGLAAREAHVRHLAREAGLDQVETEHQYVNMGPRVADRPELVDWATQAASAIDQAAHVLPVRGGTGVDPFLDRGIPIANLGTGYFAPESEKEFTSLQTMAGHALWLVALVQVLAEELPG